MILPPLISWIKWRCSPNEPQYILLLFFLDSVHPLLLCYLETSEHPVSSIKSLCCCCRRHGNADTGMPPVQSGLLASHEDHAVGSVPSHFQDGTLHLQSGWQSGPGVHYRWRFFLFLTHRLLLAPSCIGRHFSAFMLGHRSRHALTSSSAMHLKAFGNIFLGEGGGGGSRNGLTFFRIPTRSCQWSDPDVSPSIHFLLRWTFFLKCICVILP